MSKSGLLLGSEPLEEVRHKRAFAKSDDDKGDSDKKDGGDSGDDDGTDAGDSDGTDTTDSDGTDKVGGRDSDGKDR